MLPMRSCDLLGDCASDEKIRFEMESCKDRFVFLIDMWL